MIKLFFLIKNAQNRICLIFFFLHSQVDLAHYTLTVKVFLRYLIGVGAPVSLQMVIVVVIVVVVVVVKKLNKKKPPPLP